MSRQELSVLLAVIFTGLVTQLDPSMMKLFFGYVAAMGVLWTAILLPYLVADRALQAVRPRPRTTPDLSWYLKA